MSYSQQLGLVGQLAKGPATINHSSLARRQLTQCFGIAKLPMDLTQQDVTDRGSKNSVTVDTSAEKAATATPAKREGKRTCRRKDPNTPKNPLGAYVCKFMIYLLSPIFYFLLACLIFVSFAICLKNTVYQRKIMADVFEENPCTTFGEAAAECGKRWRALPESEKQEYKDLMAADKTRYIRELATFKGRHDAEVSVPKPEKGKPGRQRKHPLPPGAPKEPKRAKSAFV